MATTTISPKYQVVIPKDIREKLHLKSGQKMTVLTKGGIVYFIPEKPLETFRGFLKGMDAGCIREDKERLRQFMVCQYVNTSRRGHDKSGSLQERIV